MKKTCLIILAYALFSFAVALTTSFLIKDVPNLLPGETTSFIVFRGLLFFFELFPALASCSFMIGCAIFYGVDSHKAQIRFSSFIMNHFKKTMLASIMLVFIITMIMEVFLPLCEARQNRAQFKPVIFNEYMTLARDYYQKKDMKLAFEYSYNALLVNPSDKEALTIKEFSEAALNSPKAYIEPPEEPKYSFVPAKETSGETVTTLLEKATKAMEEEKWFEAHYYSYLAVTAGSSKDINLDAAKRISSEAWNHLFDVKIFNETDDQLLFRKKRDAYMNFIDGDNIEAYYQFLEISKISEKAARDYDVIKFLEIAEDRVSQQCFFVDEVENLRRFEAYRDIYFTIPHEDGTKDVVYIRGITPVKNSGRMIQYLRNFNLLKFSADGTFIKSLCVPYAKMLSESVENFDSDAKEKFGLKNEFKRVPYIMLESISKNDRSKKIAPVYEYTVGYDNSSETEIDNFIVLGIAQNDFNLICDTTVGSKKMSFISLMKIIPKARDFGYSVEVFSSDWLFRITYPLLMLIFLIFVADIAWNYRLKETQLFKFKWIFMTPFLTFIFYYAIECLIYTIKFLNYVLISVAGYMSIFILVGILIIALIIVSYIFVSRTDD